MVNMEKHHSCFSLQMLWSQLQIWHVKTFLHMNSVWNPSSSLWSIFSLHRECLQLGADASWFRPIIVDFCFGVSFSIESVYSWEPALLLSTGNESEKGEKAQVVHSQLKHFDKYNSVPCIICPHEFVVPKSINWQSSWPTSRFIGQSLYKKG